MGSSSPFSSLSPPFSPPSLLVPRRFLPPPWPLGAQGCAAGARELQNISRLCSMVVCIFFFFSVFPFHLEWLIGYENTNCRGGITSCSCNAVLLFDFSPFPVKSACLAVLPRERGEGRAQAPLPPAPFLLTRPSLLREISLPLWPRCFQRRWFALLNGAFSASCSNPGALLQALMLPRLTG